MADVAGKVVGGALDFVVSEIKAYRKLKKLTPKVASKIDGMRHTFEKALELMGATSDEVELMVKRSQDCGCFFHGQRVYLDEGNKYAYVIDSIDDDSPSKNIFKVGDEVIKVAGTMLDRDAPKYAIWEQYSELMNAASQNEGDTVSVVVLRRKPVTAKEVPPDVANAIEQSRAVLKDAKKAIGSCWTSKAKVRRLNRATNELTAIHTLLYGELNLWSIEKLGRGQPLGEITNGKSAKGVLPNAAMSEDPKFKRALISLETFKGDIVEACSRNTKEHLTKDELMVLASVFNVVLKTSATKREMALDLMPATNQYFGIIDDVDDDCDDDDDDDGDDDSN
jgi:hypothetical protein